MSSLSREARIYLALWRKATETPEGFEVKFPSLTTAISARQGLYRAIKPFRNRSDKDPILAEAADKYVVTLRNEPPALYFSPRQTLEILENQLESLGLSESDLLDPEELNLHRSAQRLIDQAAPTPSDRSTPFYTRED